MWCTVTTPNLILSPMMIRFSLFNNTFVNQFIHLLRLDYMDHPPYKSLCRLLLFYI